MLFAFTSKLCYFQQMQRRNTRNKEIILDTFKGKHALTVHEICELRPEIEGSTIYRNMKRFVEDGVLREVYTSHNATAYELAQNTEHDHFVCEKCNNVELISIRKDTLKIPLPITDITVRGLCRNCKKI
jgi:Fe2+ or Zn2+ uptake regulation protein